MNKALGIDVGSSSVKVSVISSDTAKALISAQFPKDEMPMITHEKSWAEQDPSMWWQALLACLEEIRSKDPELLLSVGHIGISYQMHGLVCIDSSQEVLRPAIIWCDSRAVEIGNKAMEEIGEDYCLGSLLNSPGNFTASKLKWVQENEPEIYKKIHKVMLPGDYIAMKLSGEVGTSISGLSEGIFWDFKSRGLSELLLKEYQIESELVPEYWASFSEHAVISDDVAKDLGLGRKARITYKAGDQPNNALSLNVLEPGEIAATAGTSGVVYGVVDELFVDEKQRVNSFAHVNYSDETQRIGVLLCINGVGISNAWVKRNFGFQDYVEMNYEAMEVGQGSEGLLFFPFGNGAERMLGNADLEAWMEGLNYNVHNRAHFARAVQEGIAYAFAYGMEAFTDKGIEIKKIKAGDANMFLSELFGQVLADLVGVDIELYNTDGAVGAARGALIGGQILSSDEVFEDLTMVRKYTPRKESKYPNLYGTWKSKLEQKIKE